MTITFVTRAQFLHFMNFIETFKQTEWIIKLQGQIGSRAELERFPQSPWHAPAPLKYIQQWFIGLLTMSATINNIYFKNVTLIISRLDHLIFNKKLFVSAKTLVENLKSTCWPKCRLANLPWRALFLLFIKYLCLYIVIHV